VRGAARGLPRCRSRDPQPAAALERRSSSAALVAPGCPIETALSRAGSRRFASASSVFSLRTLRTKSIPHAPHASSTQRLKTIVIMRSGFIASRWAEVATQNRAGAAPAADLFLKTVLAHELNLALSRARVAAAKTPFDTASDLTLAFVAFVRRTGRSSSLRRAVNGRIRSLSEREAARRALHRRRTAEWGNGAAARWPQLRGEVSIAPRDDPSRIAIEERSPR
jgi:hypothetical protein